MTREDIDMCEYLRIWGPPEAAARIEALSAEVEQNAAIAIRALERATLADRWRALRARLPELRSPVVAVGAGHVVRERKRFDRKPEPRKLVLERFQSRDLVAQRLVVCGAAHEHDTLDIVRLLCDVTLRMIEGELYQLTKNGDEIEPDAQIELLLAERLPGGG